MNVPIHSLMAHLDNTMLFCNDEKKVPALNAESVLSMIYKRFRRVEEENVDA